jgi:hypothetical protein
MSKAGLEVKLAGGQEIVGGYTVKTYLVGNMGSGTLGFDPLKGNYQAATNTAAITLLAPTVDCAMDILITNSATAGTISFSGFTVGTTGDPLTTTNGHKFILSIRRMNGTSTYTVKALQ